MAKRDHSVWRARNRENFDCKKSLITFLEWPVLNLYKKYVEEASKLVRGIFRVAEEHASSTVHIDEIGADRIKRYDNNSGVKRKIQRTMISYLTSLTVLTQQQT